MARIVSHPEGVCLPRFWNQGKAVHECGHRFLPVCLPRFWNQGKAKERDTFLKD